MDRHVAQEVVDVHVSLQVVPLRNVFQGLDHPLVVGLVRLGDLPVPDRLIAVQVIVGVVEVCAAAVPVHAARLLGVALRTLAGFGVFCGVCLVRRVRWSPVAEVFAVLGSLRHPIRPLFGLPAAHAHALRLIKLSALRAVIAELEAVLHALQGQVNAPIFPVDGNFGVVIEGGVRAEILVHVIDQRLL